MAAHPSRLAISAFTRVFDALWLASQDDGSTGFARSLIRHPEVLARKREPRSATADYLGPIGVS
jgi:hypothetical protein